MGLPDNWLLDCVFPFWPQFSLGNSGVFPPGAQFQCFSDFTALVLSRSGCGPGCRSSQCGQGVRGHPTSPCFLQRKEHDVGIS